MKTLLERMTEWDRWQCIKHDLHPNPQEYVEEKINEMTQYELLESISAHLEDMLKEHHG